MSGPKDTSTLVHFCFKRKNMQNQWGSQMCDQASAVDFKRTRSTLASPNECEPLTQHWTNEGCTHVTKQEGCTCATLNENSTHAQDWDEHERGLLRNVQQKWDAWNVICQWTKKNVLKTPRVYLTESLVHCRWVINNKVAPRSTFFCSHKKKKNLDTQTEIQMST